MLRGQPAAADGDADRYEPEYACKLNYFDRLLDDSDVALNRPRLWSHSDSTGCTVSLTAAPSDAPSLPAAVANSIQPTPSPVGVSEIAE
jgi:hypothetical protein